MKPEARICTPDPICTQRLRGEEGVRKHVAAHHLPPRLLHVLALACARRRRGQRGGSAGASRRSAAARAPGCEHAGCIAAPCCYCVAATPLCRHISLHPHTSLHPRAAPTTSTTPAAPPSTSSCS